MDANPNGWTTLSLTFDEGSSDAEVTINGGEQRLIGLDNVYRTSWSQSGGYEALRGHWEGDDTFVIDDQIIGDFRLAQQFRATFAGDQLLIKAIQTVTGATQSVTGHLTTP